MTHVDLVGYVAAGLVLATFCMRSMAPLRVVALGSNMMFILYGHLAKIEPVLVLHLILFPINLWRLIESLSADVAFAHWFRCLAGSRSDRNDRHLASAAIDEQQHSERLSN
jgi:hypothetical protein